MAQNLLLAVLVFCLFALGGWAATRSALRRGQSARAAKTAAAFLLLGTAAASIVFVSERHTRLTTLEEQVVEISRLPRMQDGAAYLELDFDVTHPHTPHQLRLDPQADGWKNLQPTVVQVAVSDLASHTLLDQTIEFQVITQRDDPSLPQRTDTEWDQWLGEFLPTTAGPHRLRVDFPSDAISRLKVRIRDPLKQSE